MFWKSTYKCNVAAAKSAAFSNIRHKHFPLYDSLRSPQLRDPEKTYNTTTIKELDEICPSVAWTSYLASVHALDSSSDVPSTVGKINLATTPALSSLSALLSSTPLSTLKLYMKWHAVHAYANHLSSAFVNEHFEFYGKVSEWEDRSEELRRQIFKSIAEKDST